MSPFLQKIAKFIIDVFKYHKSKLLAVFLSTFIFLLVLFPFDDLSDLVTAKIAEATDNQIFITFDQLDLSFIPTPSLSMENIKIETLQFPSLAANRMTLRPSLSSLLSFKTGFVSSIEGLWSGDLSFSLRQGSKTEEGAITQKINLEAENIDLKELKKFTHSPLDIRTKASLLADGVIDPTFGVQPEINLNLTTNTITIPASTLPTPFGELPFPKLDFSNFQLKGRLVAGEVILEEVFLGSDSDPVSARIKGKINLRMVARGPQIVPIMGAFDIKSEIKVKRGVDKTLSLFLNFLDAYKQPATDGNVFIFRTRGPDFNSSPEFSALRKID